MNKDVIHIDTEDDITSIIGKIKSSKERIIALVPPRRIGVLQSAVNIRLLARAAKSADKRVVIITSDNVLAGLAATADIPVAKTLQSKPEIAEIPALKVDDNDVIDGGQLPVGDMADSAHKKPKDDKGASGANASDAANKNKSPGNSAKSNKKKPKIPDFNVFRKKFALIGGGVLLLIIFLVWATWFAPHATVIITAKTTGVKVSETVKLTTDDTVSAKNDSIKVQKRELQKEISVEFAATGKKNVGEKATGSVRFSNSSKNSVTIAAGTILKNNDLSYVLSSSVTVPAATLSWDCSDRTCSGTATASVRAAEGGSQYNAASGSMSISVDGIKASLMSPTSGGTDKTATVVTASDVASAKSKLNEQKDNSLKNQLAGSFGSSAKVITDSYSENRSDPVPSVAVDSEASGSVLLKSTITASMLAADKSDIKSFIDAKIREDDIGDKKSQKIYDSGVDKAEFSQFTDRGGIKSLVVTANGKIGPEINESKVKEQAKGRTYGDVQSSIESIEGVEDVDVKFSPFWVRSVPNDIKKINVEFKLKDAK
jgi:hypothetical protein cdiviTM7_03019